MAGFEVWLVAASIFFIGELFTTGFFLLWFGIGAIITALFAFLGLGDDILQSMVFLISSSTLTLLTRPIAEKITKKTPRKAAVDSLLGKTGRVLETINPEKNKGIVRVRNEEWRAEAPETIETGETVTVLEVNGTHIIVKKSGNR